MHDWQVYLIPVVAFILSVYAIERLRAAEVKIGSLEIQVENLRAKIRAL